MTNTLATPPLPTRRWKRVEYDRLIDLGMFHPDERLELIDGFLVLRDRQSPPHATTIRLALETLRSVFGAGWDVRGRAPIALDDYSEPEPDVSVVPGSLRDYVDAHPSRPALVIEVADTSLAFDRDFKSSLYARAGLPDYWLANLVDHVLEVHRDPVPSATAPYGWAYTTVNVLQREENVTPLAAPTVIIPIVQFLLRKHGPPLSSRENVSR